MRTALLAEAVLNPIVSVLFRSSWLVHAKGLVDRGGSIKPLSFHRVLK